ncbi:MAG: segregation/condensation protein A, partial [Atopobium sp.]|nr:segregation/condensation protein A [Atopobium sp.]
SKGKVTFSELLDGQDTPEIVVANFLAVLELFKRGLVRVQQDAIFGEIEIEHIEGTDSYQLDESVLLELEELSGDEPDLEGLNLSQNALQDVQQTLLSLTHTPNEVKKEAE